MTPICSPPISGNSIFLVPQPSQQMDSAILANMPSDMSLSATQRKGS